MHDLHNCSIFNKVVHQLGCFEYIRTKKGKNGDIQFLKLPSQIKVGEIIRQFESNFHLAECFKGHENVCVISQVCGLKGILNDAFKTFIHKLDQYTLADITSGQNELTYANKSIDGVSYNQKSLN